VRCPPLIPEIADSQPAKSSAFIAYRSLDPTHLKQTYS
jgi:hypothetical protein